MGPVPLGGLFTASRASAILLVTGGVAVVYGVLELVGIAPRRTFIGRNLDPKIQSLVIVLIGVALLVLGLVLR